MLEGRFVRGGTVLSYRRVEDRVTAKAADQVLQIEGQVLHERREGPRNEALTHTHTKRESPMIARTPPARLRLTHGSLLQAPRASRPVSGVLQWCSLLTLFTHTTHTLLSLRCGPMALSAFTG